MLREEDRHFLSSLYAAISIIFIWKGLWEGIYELPYFPKAVLDPFVFLFLGFVMLYFSKGIFREFDPLGGIEKAVNRTLQNVHHHPHKNDFVLRYHDNEQKKDVNLSAQHLRGIEKGALILKHHQKREELFLPTHRVTEVFYKGRMYWRL